MAQAEGSEPQPSAIAMPPVELTLIVAATRNMGIGLGGTLPWTGLRKEMAYFARVTKGKSSSINVTPHRPANHCAANVFSAIVQKCCHYGQKDMGEHTRKVPPLKRPLEHRAQPL
jgi:hypothetical protein